MLFCFQLKWLRKDLVPTAFPARKLTQSFCHWGWRFTELRWNYIDLLWISRENRKIHARVCVCVPSNHNQRKITQPLNLTQNDPKIFIFTFFQAQTIVHHLGRTSFKDNVVIFFRPIVYKIPRVTEHHRRALEAGILQILALLPSTFHLTFFSFDIQLSFNKINPDVRSFTQYSSIFISVWME